MINHVLGNLLGGAGFLAFGVLGGFALNWIHNWFKRRHHPTTQEMPKTVTIEGTRGGSVTINR